MAVEISSHSLTRVVVDAAGGIEIAQLHTVLGRIEDALGDVPVAQRDYLANALLNLALSRFRELTAKNA